VLLSDVTKWGKCKFYVTVIKWNLKQDGHTNRYRCLCLIERKNGALKLCMELVLRPCTVHVVLFVSLCWCVSDCMGTANGAMFLCDIALAVYYVQR